MLLGRNAKNSIGSMSGELTSLAVIATLYTTKRFLLWLNDNKLSRSIFKDEIRSCDN